MKKKESRQVRYVDRQNAKGVTRVCIMVPTVDADRVKKYAARLRKQKRAQL